MFKFPVGYRTFHPIDQINYQINRWLPTADEAEFVQAAQVANFGDWEKNMLAIAERAAAEGRHLHASTYFRAAEFFMGFDNPLKAPTYEQYRRHVLQVDVGRPYERCEIPFRDGRMPAFRFAAEGEKRDTLVIHGGFDSYVEEFLFWGAEYAGFGFEVILFEGPGQGASLREFGLKMDPEWEHPVGAVLDHFGVESCTLMGLSLGGYLAPRAAAHEPRVRRVIALNMLYDFFDCFASRLGSNAGVAISRKLAAGAEAGLDQMMRQLQAANPAMGWAFAHGMHISGSRSVVEYLRWLKRMSTASFSHQITQDVLVIAGSEDHIVPLEQFYEQLRALTNARSVTGRLFTAQDHGQAHCQVGNLRLVLDYMRSWLEFQLSIEHR
ncbi:alpha/beta hydrolase [Phenylobacterium sp.]|uniref:alpha/beta hydrolase n=1 Tax=Phenylobacterium sp. TaxID=1871053 RepID=UPI0035B07C50